MAEGSAMLRENSGPAYPLEDAIKLFGAVEGFDAQLPQ